MGEALDRMAWVANIAGTWAFADLFGRYTEIVGLKITAIMRMECDEGLRISFEDGTCLRIKDEGQSCCERRYVTCDDDLSWHVGGRLISIDMDAAGPQPEHDENDYGVHEVQFVKVQTTEGSFTLCTHNEHSGYYGGFNLKLERTR